VAAAEPQLADGNGRDERISVSPRATRVEARDGRWYSSAPFGSGLRGRGRRRGGALGGGRGGRGGEVPGQQRLAAVSSDHGGGEVPGRIEAMQLGGLEDRVEGGRDLRAEPRLRAVVVLYALHCTRCTNDVLADIGNRVALAYVRGASACRRPRSASGQITCSPKNGTG